MSYQMSGFSKLCGTCCYWVGEREPNYYASAAELPSQSTKGKCYCPNGPFLKGERYSNTCACGNYKKWCVLR